MHSAALVLAGNAVLRDVFKKRYGNDERVPRFQRVLMEHLGDVEAYLAKKAEEAAAAAAQAEAEAKAKAEADRLANPTTEDLLKAILTELQSK